MRGNNRIGKNFRGLLNDIKRRPEDAARELGVELEEVNAIISGEKNLSADIIARAAAVWPLNSRDFHIIDDDCPDGVKIMRASDSEKSGRVMNRAGKPYYEYRDTAMSKVGQFRPEWIEELCIVDDNDPENSDVQWNNGHFMHQFTYFIGPVNFYYKGADGSKNVAVMNTGDSMYITPFVPHTFTTRKNPEGRKGLILALTYGNKLAGETQQELSALGPSIGTEYALDFSSREKAFSSLLRFHRNSANFTVEELANRTGFSVENVGGFESGVSVPEMSILQSLADALMVNVSNLLPLDKQEDKVIVRKYEDSKRWFYPAENSSYEIVELAATKDLPHSKSFEFNIHAANGFDLDLKCGLHQYIYNAGLSTVQVNWRCNGKDNSATLSPDDSLYMKPFINHNFRGKGKLLVLRIGGRVAGEPLRELSLIGKNNAERAIAETMQWFNVKGRQNI
jgi:transcriptional regulator with XRE-family HTH domain